MGTGDLVTDHRLPAGTGQRNTDALAQLHGEAPSFRRAIANLPAIAGSSASVLVTGETGTGKELVARALHNLSPRLCLPFVPLNCGAFSEDLFQDELFGHERGAFTDARSERSGLIALAKGGTLFLDEVDSLPLRCQVALLRVLEEQTFRPLGSNEAHRLDVRFIAATNACIQTRVREGSFREDLYFRLQVHTVYLPPLRERREDITLLVAHFLAKYQPAEVSPPQLSAGAQRRLASYQWPGNVRELENVIRRAIAVANGGVIELAELDLPAQETKCPKNSSDLEPRTLEELERACKAMRRCFLIRLISDHQGNVSQAARAASMDRRYLSRLLENHAVEPHDYCPSL